MPPRRIGAIEIDRIIGKGAYARVYAGRMRGANGFERDVAVKILDAGRLTRDPKLVAALADEAHLLSRLDHPNIVRVYSFESHDVGGEDETYALIMERVTGQSLEPIFQWLTVRESPLSLDSVLVLIRQLASALEHIHSATDFDGQPLRLVHRDLKPSNVIVSRDGDLKVIDFGIAWAINRQVSDTVAGLTKGSLPYMCPEQLRGKKLDGRADIFALGVIAFELLTAETYFGIDPKDRRPVGQLMRAVYNTDFAERGEVLKRWLLDPAGHGLDDRGAQVVLDLFALMLARDRDERPSRAGEIADRIDRLDLKWDPKRGLRTLASVAQRVSSAVDAEPGDSAIPLPTDAMAPVDSEELDADPREIAETIKHVVEHGLGDAE